MLDVRIWREHLARSSQTFPASFGFIVLDLVPFHPAPETGLFVWVGVRRCLAGVSLQLPLLQGLNEIHWAEIILLPVSQRFCIHTQRLSSTKEERWLHTEFIHCGNSGVVKPVETEL